MGLAAAGARARATTRGGAKPVVGAALSKVRARAPAAARTLWKAAESAEGMKGALVVVVAVGAVDRLPGGLRDVFWQPPR